MTADRLRAAADLLGVRWIMYDQESLRDEVDCQPVAALLRAVRDMAARCRDDWTTPTDVQDVIASADALADVILGGHR